MTSGKIITCILLISISLVSCEDKDDEILRTPKGLSLLFVNRPAEMAYVYENCSDIISGACLYIHVTSALKEMPTYATPQHYSIEGDEMIEQQIRSFLDPEGTKYTGGMISDIVEYRTEVCKSICITLYDKNDTSVIDMTDNARFYYTDVPSETDIYNRLLINSEKKLLGTIEIGSTIKDYLSHSPMIFAEALLSFPDYDNSIFDNGNYAKVEIELGNGTTLTAYTSSYSS